MKKLIKSVHDPYWFLPVCVLGLFLGLIGAGLSAFGGNNTTPDPNLHCFNKPLPTGFGNPVQPNVLLLLDTSGSMTFDQNGNYTYGDGSQPYNGQIYWGYDTISTNNDPSNPYNYYDSLIYENGTSGTLVPNDSRMYQLKLVLWNILSDPTLTSGMRIAMSTYYQQNYWGDSDWYKVQRYFGGPETQQISWHGAISGHDDALLRFDFASTDSSDTIPNLLLWINGSEGTNDPELRADGNTPLAESIYQDPKQFKYNGGSEGAANLFFVGKGRSVVNYWCQKNFLIVITDGEEQTAANRDPVAAVQNLYNSNMKGYQPIITYVIGLAATDSLKAILNKMADRGDDGRANNSATAYFANDVPGLLSALRAIFHDIQNRSATGGAPLISTPRNPGDSLEIYTPSFYPKSDRQWIGDFTCSVLSADVLTQLWSAKDALNQRDWSTRAFYTVDWLGSLNSSNGTCAFSKANANALANDLFNTSSPSPTQQSQAGNLIQWLLGKDVWQEGSLTNRPNKLADSFHSGFVKVGPPTGYTTDSQYLSFVSTWQNRDKVVYIQTNDGVLHAFNVSDGTERWGFVPPNALSGGRLTGLKTNTTGWDSTATSYPRYILDGPVTAEDVQFTQGGAFHTVLVAMDGNGGAGLYALDITNPSQPVFLWAVENNIYDPSLSTEKLRPASGYCVSRWIPSSTGAVTRTDVFHQSIPTGDKYDYTQLRFTMSTPFIGKLSNGEWAVFFGNGPTKGMSGDNNALSSIYIVSPATGEIKRILTGANNKQFVTPVAAVAQNTSRVVKTFYTGDSDGLLYKGDVSDANYSNWTLTSFFSITGNVGLSYSLEAGLVGGQVWLFTGTGDSEGLLSSQSNNNFFLALNTAGGATNMNQLTQLDPTSSASVASNTQGWYMTFPTGEVMSTPPVLYNGYLYFATYSPSSDPCNVGNSNFYVVRAKDGQGAWGGQSAGKYFTLDKVRVSGLAVYGGRVYLGVTNFGNKNLPSGYSFAGGSQNLLMGPVLNGGGSGGTPSQVVQSKYWREWLSR